MRATMRITWLLLSLGLLFHCVHSDTASTDAGSPETTRPAKTVTVPPTTVSDAPPSGGDPPTTVSAKPATGGAAGGDPPTTVSDTVAAVSDPPATVSGPPATIGDPPASGSDTTGTGVTGGDVTGIKVTTEKQTASKPTPTPTSETSQHGTIIKGSAATTPTMPTDKDSSSEPQQSGAATTKPLTPSNSGSHVEQPSSPAVSAQDVRPTQPNVPPGNPGSVTTVPPGVPGSSETLSGPIGGRQDATGSATQSTTISKDSEGAVPPGVPGSPVGQGQDAAGSGTQSTTISKDNKGAGAVENAGTAAPTNMKPTQTTAGTPHSAGGAVIPSTISTRPAGDKAVISPGQAAATTTQAPPAASLSTTTTTTPTTPTTTTTTTTLAQPRMFSFSLHEGQEREDEKELVAVCKRLMEDMHVGNCTLVWRQHKGKTVIDSAELNGRVKAALANQYYAEITKKSHDNTTLIAILASCGALLAMIIGLAIYASHHCKPYNENQQHLTEELHTVENGYHDNPTLEVMEVQPEMQEKKVALNGEFNDSWIVPMDNLLKEDMPDEEDTHL